MAPFNGDSHRPPCRPQLADKDIPDLRKNRSLTCLLFVLSLSEPIPSARPEICFSGLHEFGS